jgi:ATP-dependent RNA helicase DDX42
METEKPGSSSQGGVRNDLEEEDVEESYYRYMEENPTAGLAPVEDENPDLEYDEDGNPIPPDKKKIIDPLPPIDHSTIEYKPFEKNFYKEHPEITSLTNKQVAELRKTFDLTVSGTNPPKPVSSFAHFNFDDKLLKAIIKAEYISPTPIQAQAVPCSIQGRDVLGIAQTGSGKTAAFLWPLLKHVSAQPPVVEGEGPAALILAPTRELAIQIYNEAKKFARVYDLTVVCAYGGGSKWEQSLALKEGADIVVATPGRIIDHVKGGATNLQRVTFLVLDEADRMFELGFEPQVRSVCNHVRPDRQTLLFSATFRKRIEKLAKDALIDPVRISQGITGQANEDVTQKVLLMENQQLKRDWLVNNLVEMLSAGSVLVFVTKKSGRGAARRRPQSERIRLFAAARRHRAGGEEQSHNRVQEEGVRFVGGHGRGSSRSGHPPHSHSSELRHSQRHRHSHPPDRSDGARRQPGYSLHVDHPPR